MIEVIGCACVAWTLWEGLGLVLKASAAPPRARAWDQSGRELHVEIVN